MSPQNSDSSDAAAVVPALLKVDGLIVAIEGGDGSVHPVDGVSFEVGRGELACLVGESGSGKSLTALAVMGLLPPAARTASGSILLNGREISGLSDGGMRKIRGVEAGMIFQEPLTALNPLLTVGFQISEAMTAHGTSRREAEKRTLELLVEAGVRDPIRVSGSYPHQLSGGLRQRAMIATALACGPSLLIADEPTTALDATVSLQILGLIEGLRRTRGMGVLLITHDFGVVREVADRVAVIYAGMIVEEGPAESVLNAPLHPYTEALINALPGGRGRVPGSMLPVIPGSVREPSDRSPGCRFAPRCDRALPECREMVPEQRIEGAGRVACLSPNL